MGDENPEIAQAIGDELQISELRLHDGSGTDDACFSHVCDRKGPLWRN